jgi:hypothetical protein
MTDSSEESAPVNEVAKEPALGVVIDFVTRVIAPASFLTAILYYFGYTREHAFYGYFGVDLESLRFSSTDYLVRSVGTIFVPIGTVLAFGFLALTGHHLIAFILSRASGRRRSGAWAGVGAAAVALLGIGVVGLEWPTETNLPVFLPPISLGTGALLLEYSVFTAIAYAKLPKQLHETLMAAKLLRRIMIGALLLVSAFWGIGISAQERGDSLARAIEVSLPVQPEAVVYSRQRLQIGGFGVTFEALSKTDAAFNYRYGGLRPLIHSGGYWFLLPAGWTHDNGGKVIVLSDALPGIRVDLGP